MRKHPLATLVGGVGLATLATFIVLLVVGVTGVALSYSLIGVGAVLLIGAVAGGLMMARRHRLLEETGEGHGQLRQGHPVPAAG
jgi:hypothetical protein